MPEQSGNSVAALRARQAQLADRKSGAAEADHALARLLADVHTAMRRSARRLDAVAGEIDSAAARIEHLAADTPLGVRELQAFLVAKQREAAAVVAEARDLARAKSVELRNLRTRYT